ncbi:MAG: hypothetical protein KAJ55_03345 [Anaerolineales bacterium]|nr:hypothetical protein [Anaerolineales bacterium]
MENNTCYWCGGPYQCELLEVWEDGDFMLDTCCEGAMQECVAYADREDWKRLFNPGDDKAEDGAIVLRQVYDNHFALKADYGVMECAVTLTQAKEFIRRWHRHHKPPTGWRWGHALASYTDPFRRTAQVVGVAMVGRPVARAINHREVVEVNRLCVHPEIDSGLVWNVASQLYGAAWKEAKRRGFKKIITYTLESESGVSLKAAGWTPEAKTKGGSWNTPARSRQDKGPTCRKIRWARELTK